MPLILHEDNRIDPMISKAKTFLSGPLGTVLLAVALTFASPSWAETLKVGTISVAPVDEIRTFQPFADYLADALKEDGFDGAEVVIAADVHQMASLLKSGAVDLFIDSSVAALVVTELSGAQYMLRRWKKGRDQYRSVIFVRDDSPIVSLDDLRGKLIAFEEPFSTSGFMLPAMTLYRAGLELSEVKSTASLPPADSLGFIMAYDNETQSAWLERGRVQAAAMAEKDFKDFSETALAPLRALHHTPYVPYHVVVNRSDLDGALVDRIKTVLKGAHESKTGRAVLDDFERTAKFDDIPPPLLDEVMGLKPFLHLIIAPH